MMLLAALTALNATLYAEFGGALSLGAAIFSGLIFFTVLEETR